MVAYNPFAFPTAPVPRATPPPTLPGMTGFSAGGGGGRARAAFDDQGGDGGASYPDGGGGSTPAPPSGGYENVPCAPGYIKDPIKGCIPANGERNANDWPCPSGQCKDVATGACRTFNPNREKVNETDEWERESGGGRGYCKQRSGGGAGGGGGAGKGAGAGAPGAAKGNPLAPGAASTDFDALLQKYIKDNLAAPSRYTPEALQALYGQITSQSAGAIRRGTRAVQQNAAQRNMQRAGSTGAAIQDVRNSAEQQRGAAMVGVQLEKIKADHQDKMDALDRAQKYLDSLRDNEYRYTLMGEQRRQFDANLALAYANLAQQKSMLQMQLQSQWDMLRAQQGFLLATGST